MRIILGLAAAAAAAIGTAAAARPGGSPGGPGGGSQPAWSSGGHHFAKGRHGRPRTGWVGTDRRRGPGHGRFDDRRDFHPYGAAGIAGPVGEVDPYGNGFFTGAGGQISLRGGRPHYDYDRSYPYEWASAAGGRREWVVVEERTSEPPARCTFENGVRVCRGW
jgi:hypothetical protein